MIDIIFKKTPIIHSKIILIKILEESKYIKRD